MSNSIEKWRHDHNFTLENEHGEKRTLYVLILTAITMVIEIIAGSIYGSMALLADGWHMGTHVAAFMITIFAYRYARKHSNNPKYSFGTGKVNVLGGFASAVALAVVALVMMIESIQRIYNPHEIYYNQAIAVAVLGLVVNLISALMLKDHHRHHGEHDHHHHDHNLRAAYFHVLADAMTSLLAIFALVSAKYLGLTWLDPVMGIIGAIIITRWAYGLVKNTSPILLDGSIEQQYLAKIKEKIESEDDNQISDLHIWLISPVHHAAAISIVTKEPKSPDYYKSLLVEFNHLSHVTIEINHRGTL